MLASYELQDPRELELEEDTAVSTLELDTVTMLEEDSTAVSELDSITGSTLELESSRVLDDSMMALELE